MSKTIEIKDVGPVEHLRIPLPEGGGLVVLKGENGVGKTHSLDAVSALVGGSGKVPSRDGSLGAHVEGLGARLTIGRRANHSGEVEISHLEGEDPSLLVDPGIKSQDAADAARLKALLRLARASVDTAAFAALVGGQDRLEALCRPASLNAREDVPSMAAAIKRDLEAAARAAETKAENGFAKADGVRATLREIEGEEAPQRRCEDAAKARQAHTAAVRKHSELETRKSQSETLKTAADEARASLAEYGDDGTPEAVAAAREGLGECEENVARLRKELAEAVATRDNAQADVDQQERARRQRGPLQRAIAAASDAPEVDDEQIRKAAEAVTAAESELGAWALFERTGTLRDQIDALDADAKAASEEGVKLREAARGTETVVLDAVRSVCGDDMEIHEGRLYVNTDRGKELFSDLSHGERWRKALDIAVAAVGTSGILIVRQEANESLSPRNRKEIAEYAKKLGVVILTAAADDGEIRAEVHEPEAQVAAN